MNEIVLNPQQQRAVTFGDYDTAGNFFSNPLLIIAGAGTGKTNTLAHRAAHLIISGVAADRILIMTFSRRAAKELVNRTKRIIINQLKQSKSKNTAKKTNIDSNSPIHIPWMGTFHSIANRLLRHHGKSIGMDPNFTIIDRNDAEDLIDLLRHELKLSKKTKRFPKKSTCINIYSRCVNAQEPVEKILKKYFPWCKDWSTELRQLFKLYSERKLEQVTLDYDDLLLYWYHLVEEKEIANLIRSQFDHILVDEYQDTNILQAGILTRIFPDGKGLTVVGDDAQSIYSFRSAEIENILNFPKLFSPAAEVISLKTNYRSIQPILDLSNQLLAESKLGYKKELLSHKTSNNWFQLNKPHLVSVEDDQAQAQYIVEKVISEREAGVELRQQAVLFRNGHHSDRLEIELMRHDIPFVKYGGLKFLEAAHVKDLLSIVRWIDNPKHHISGFRVLKLLPGVGPGTAMKILDYLQLHQFQFAALDHFKIPNSATSSWKLLLNLLISSQSQDGQWPSQMELAKLFYQPLLEENYEDFYAREGDLEQIINIAGQYPTRESFISELTLDPPISSGDLCDKAHKDDDFLILSTIHSAKGQEWKNVFILNVADGNFPNEYAADDPKAIEEERRLLNVAITRAKQNLHLIQPLKYWVPEQPKYGDKHVYGAKSRFLTKKVSHCLEASFYPEQQSLVAEPTIQYQGLSNVQNKIRDMW